MWAAVKVCQVGFRPAFKNAVPIGKNPFNAPVVKNQFVRETSSKINTLSHTLRRKTAVHPGAAFTLGRAAAMGAGAIGIGYLSYYGLSVSNKAGLLEKSALWPEYVKNRVQTTFMYVGGSLGIAALAAVSALRSPGIMRICSSSSIGVNLLLLGSLVGSSMLVQSLPYTPGFGPKQLGWMGFASLIGVMLAPLSFVGGPIIIRAALNTAGIVGGLSLIAVSAPSEQFLKYAGPLAMGCGLVFISGLGSMFLPPTTHLGAGLHSIFLYGGLIVFSGLFLYNCQNAVYQAERIPPDNVYSVVKYDPINMSMSLFMDIVNIFVRMVLISGSSGNKR